MYYKLELTMYYYCLWYDKLWGPSQRVVTLFYIPLQVGRRTKYDIREVKSLLPDVTSPPCLSGDRPPGSLLSCSGKQ